MTGKGPKGGDGGVERARRSAEALRANLRRRKGQERDRAEPPAAMADESMDLPVPPATAPDDSERK